MFRSRGMDAMAERSLASDVSRLWQLPLLLFSLALFGYATYLLIDPPPSPTAQQRIDVARGYLRQERPDAAVQMLNRVLQNERLDQPMTGTVHLMLAEAIEMAQRLRRMDLPSNHEQIVVQTRLAIGSDIDIGAPGYLRMAESLRALGEREQSLRAYRTALALDTDRALRLHRTVINLLLESDQRFQAAQELENYLRQTDLTDAERSWALGLRAQMLIDEEQFTAAQQLLDEAQELTTGAEPTHQGELAYRQAYAAWKLGQIDEAERRFRMARELLGVGSPLDAEAALALGRIHQARNQIPEAISFFNSIIVSHPTNPLMHIARIERGVSRAKLGEDEAALEDLRNVVLDIERKPALRNLRDEAMDAVVRAEQLFWSRDNPSATLEALGYELVLDNDPDPAYFGRLGQAYERQAQQLEEKLARPLDPEDPESALSEADVLKAQQQIRDLLTKAGSAYIAYANKLVVVDDEANSALFWRGIDAFDRAGNSADAIAALEVWVTERPDNPETPRALLRLGRTYQAAGLMDRAISVLTRNQIRYPQTLDSTKSSVPLAQALIAKGPEFHRRAEETLISVVDNNPILDPTSTEFRDAVFELASLYYRSQRFEEAIGRLEEFRARYPEDPRYPQIAYLMADSYRQSAKQLAERIQQLDNPTPVNPPAPSTVASAPTTSATAGAASTRIDRPADRLEMNIARRERLRKSRDMFELVIELARENPPTSDLDHLHLKLAHFYRADCLFDLGEYAEAIRLYDAAAFRYQDDPGALAAYVQIVNSYVALGRTEEARTANERARVLLRRIPPDAFTDGTYTIPREFWDQWLSFTGDTKAW